MAFLKLAIVTVRSRRMRNSVDITELCWSVDVRGLEVGISAYNPCSYAN